MAKKAIAQIEIGDQTISRYSHIQITQSLFGHHDFLIQVPIEAIEGQGSNVFGKSKNLIGKPIKISLGSEQLLDTDNQKFLGLVTELSLSRFHGAGNDLIIKGKSPTILLDDGFQCRSFSEKDLSNIVDELVKNYPSNLLTTKVSPTFDGEIPYVVQYRESNFHFLYRIANLFGEWCYFNGSELIFGQAENQDPIGLRLGRELFSFNIGMGLSPVNFQLHAYDYVKNEVLESLASDAEVSNLDPLYGEPAFKESESLFAQSPLTPAIVPIAEKSELDELVARKRKQQSSSLVRLNGTSDHIAVGIGRTVGISGNKNENVADGLEDYGEFVVINIKHRIEGNGDYHNQFEAIPKEASVPPPNPHVRIPNIEAQPAVVKENYDEDKKLGRIRVQFYWQKDPEMTPWIRQVSSSGGAQGGFFVIPEIGDEVMVAFEHNHPDKPYVLGSVFHGNGKPASNWASDSNYIKSIKTKSGNEIILNDEGGTEEIKILNKGGENSIILSMSSGGVIRISSQKEMSLSSTKISISASDELSMSAKNIKVNAEQNFELTTGQHTLITAHNGFVVNGDEGIGLTSSNGTMSITSKGDASLSSVEGAVAITGKGDAAVVSSDGAVTLDAKGNATVNSSTGAVNLAGKTTAKLTGQMVTVEGSGGPAIVKGTIVQLN